MVHGDDTLNRSVLVVDEAHLRVWRMRHDALQLKLDVCFRKRLHALVMVFEELAVQLLQKLQ
jgi:hypothetical protein